MPLRCFRGAGLRLLGVIAGVLVATAACSKDKPYTVLQDVDFTQPKGFDGQFDPANVFDNATFTDGEHTDAAEFQTFLEKNNPYDRPSFLETYSSNGVRASAALVKAGREYQINPIVLLAYAQATQGLVGLRDYPFPTDRVEYVFRCGCLQSGVCLPELAGFDRQIECVARALRDSLTAIAANQTTPGGWGPNRDSITLDGITITPANPATAALYDRTPRVAEGKEGGTWILWNLFNLYASQLNYHGPSGQATQGAWIGDPCQTSGACGYANPTCATNYPGGICTAACTGDCPSSAGRPQAFCAVVPGVQTGYCFPICNPQASACRNGYQCLQKPRFRGKDSQPVCFPVATQ